MTAPRRFRFAIDGLEWHGVALPTERELDLYLAGRGLALPGPLPTSLAPVPDGSPVRPVGRPGYAALIAAALAALDPTAFDGVPNTRSRARIVLRQVACMVPPDQLPALRTIEKILAESAACRNECRNYRQNSDAPNVRSARRR